MSLYRHHILVCNGDHEGCKHSDSQKIMVHFQESLDAHDLNDEVKLISCSCLDCSGHKPLAIVYPEGVRYTPGNAAGAQQIINEHIIEGRICTDRLFKDPKDLDSGSIDKASFFRGQTRVALKNCGVIDPECIDEYLAVDGYLALEKCLTEMTPEGVIGVIKDSGLRGRGGGGFPTGLKWELTRKAAGEKKYVICNADEGDPGAFMDRSVLEGDPHAVLEAMMIAGYAIGADEGVLYVRAEYPLAVQRLRTAISQAEEYGLIGDKILGTDFNFHFDLRLGSGAFVCGEETALIASIEGYRGEPRQRPPFPAQKGLFDESTLINNVETFANVTRIILNGAEWFSAMGINRSKGTKVFALGGKINNTGLVEIPMGLPLRDIIYKIGGGIPNDKKFKAAQTGGPSGGCIPAELIDTPIDYDNLQAIGTMIGSGGLIVMDEDTCMVDIAKFFLEFTADESCGKCTPCRVGTKRMLEILTRITKGQGEEGDVEKLQRLAAVIQDTALCGLGQTAPNPVLSTIRYFRSEYDSHIIDKICPAGSCVDLLRYSIKEDICRGCGLCFKGCPVGAITGERKKPHEIHQDKCIKCGACIANCPFKAIIRQ